MSIYQKRYVRGISYIYIFLLISSIFVYAQTDIGADEVLDEKTGEKTSEKIGEDIDEEQGDAPLSETELLFFSEDDADNILASGADTGIGAGDVFRVFFVLMVLLGIGVGVVWLLRKFQAKNINFNTNIIDVISSKQLSQTSSLHIVKVANEYMLIGNSEHAINLIKAYTEKEKIDEITLALSEAEAENSEGGTPQTFLKRLQKKLFMSNNLAMSKNPNKNKASTNIVSMILERREK